MEGKLKGDASGSCVWDKGVAYNMYHHKIDHARRLGRRMGAEVYNPIITVSIVE